VVFGLVTRQLSKDSRLGLPFFFLSLRSPSDLAIRFFFPILLLAEFGEGFLSLLLPFFPLPFVLIDRQHDDFRVCWSVNFFFSLPCPYGRRRKKRFPSSLCVPRQVAMIGSTSLRIRNRHQESPLKEDSVFFLLPLLFFSFAAT